MTSPNPEEDAVEASEQPSQDQAEAAAEELMEPMEPEALPEEEAVDTTPNQEVEVQCDLHGFGLAPLSGSFYASEVVNPETASPVNVALLDARYVVPPIAQSSVVAVVVVSGAEPHACVTVAYYAPRSE